MTKKEKAVVEQFYIENNIDLRTMATIVHYYIDIGENRASKITPESIQVQYNNQLQAQKKAEAEGHNLIVTPEFVTYLLTACMKLAELDNTIRYKIIKEWL